jgi:ATP/maltotriose-dependent transcriptional regulator MalT
VKSTLQEAAERGEGLGVSTAHWTTALLANGLGHYEEAAAAAKQVLEPVGGRLDATINWALPELVEAAVRCGSGHLARDAIEQLSEMTRASGTDWALGLEARSRALLSERDAAEPLFREAVDRLSRTRQRGDRARAHLLFGEWMRREGRRNDAREHLRTAHGVFLDMGANAFAARARRELRVIGDAVRPRSADRVNKLTAQERQIARLAIEGLSNAEIGERIFLSARTVEWHLGKVFVKLGIQSRRELPQALPTSWGPVKARS